MDAHEEDNVLFAFFFTKVPYGKKSEARGAIAPSPSPLGGEGTCSSLLWFFLCLLLLFSACTSSEKETSKALVKIDNVTLSRLDDHTLRVTMNYDLEAGVTLPLPYKSVLVFPLEPRGKLAGEVPTVEFSTGLIALDLEIPSDAGFTWQDLEAKEACCVVALKGTKEGTSSSGAQYERISNSVTVPLPPSPG